MAVLMVGLGACSGWTRSCEPPDSDLTRRDATTQARHALDRAPASTADGWPVSTLSAEGIRPGPIAEMLRAIDDGTYTKIDSVLIARHGKLVLEAYFNGFTRARRHNIQSVTKGFTSALIGIAVGKGMIGDIHAPVSTYFPDYWPSIENGLARKNRLTLKHLLQMTAGFDPEKGGKLGRDPANALSPDWIEHVLDLPMTDDPGTRFSYSSSASFLLGRVLARATGSTVPAFAKANLFAPLGIDRYCWKLTDRQQTLTHSGFFLRPRDMAKFGQLYLRDGVWRGRQVDPAAWIAGSVAWQVETKSTRAQKARGVRNGYGYQWWVQLADPGADATLDTYLAVGNGGQKISVYPNLDMVVVFTGGHYGKPVGHRQTRELLRRYILPAARGTP